MNKNRPAAMALALTPWLFGCAGLTPPGARDPVPSQFMLDPVVFSKVLAGNFGLCTGRDGEISACTPRPRVNWEARRLAMTPVRDMSTLPPQDKPTWVLCRVDYQAMPPVWECAEIYSAVPK